MRKMTIIGQSRNQVMRFIIEATRKNIDVALYYNELQNGWFISFDFEDFSVRNLRVTTSGNFLHQFRNLIPFGLSCVVDGDQEPTLLEDFSSGRAAIYLLDESEVKAFSEVISGQATA